MARRVPRDWDDVDETDVTIRHGVRHAPARDFLDIGALGGRRDRSRSRQGQPIVVVDNHFDDHHDSRERELERLRDRERDRELERLRDIERERDRERDRSRGPRGRRGRDSDEDLIDAVEDVAKEIRRNRSRTPLPPVQQQPGWDPRDGAMHTMEMELTHRRREMWEVQRERERLEKELERDRLEHRLDSREKSDFQLQLERTRSKIKRLEEERQEVERVERRKDERERFLLEKEKEDREEREKRRLYKLEIERKEQEKEDEEKRLLEQMRGKEARKKKETDEQEQRTLLAYEKKKNDEKKKREEIVAQFKAEEEEKKRKDKEEEERWQERLAKKKRDEEEKKKKHEEELEEEMRKKLHKFGFQENQVDAIVDPKKAPQLPSGFRPSNALVPIGGIGGPTYVKIHRNHVDIETLKYFGLPWGYDPGNSEYYLIYQEMDKKETEILFEHTRKHRKRHVVKTELLIEERGRDRHGGQNLAFVRRRTPSRSPGRHKERRDSSPKRVLKLWP